MPYEAFFFLLLILLIGGTQAQACTTNGGDSPNVPCIFPFRFNGVTYNQCALDSDGYWCSTKVNSSGEHIGGQGNWGTCSESCPKTTVDCSRDENKVTLRVDVEFRELPLRKVYHYIEKISATDSFKKSYRNLDTSAEVEGSYKLFSARAKVTYNQITEKVSRLKTFEKTIREDLTEYQKGTYQIVRDITSQVEINGNLATMVETKFVDSIPISQHNSPAQLYQKAKDEINRRYGGSKRGSINGATYTESTCIKKKVKFSVHSVDPELIWNDKSSGGRYDFSCWGPGYYPGNSGYYPIGHFGNGAYQKPQRAYVLSLSEPSWTGILKRPTGFNRIWKDSGSGASLDGSFWSVGCPLGYQSLSDVCRRGYDEPDIYSVWCINDRFLESDHHDNLIWNDRGTGAYSDVDINGGQSELTKELVSATTERGSTKYLRKIKSTYLS